MNLQHCILLIAFFCSLTSCSYSTENTESKAQATLPQQTITINTHTLRVEVATTNAQRRAGLAHRKTLAPDSGMLFVYSDSRVRFFTTAQTSLALSIAFMDEHGIIQDIQKMQPFNTSSYRSKSDARYVLEVNQGWFEHRGVTVGDKASLPDTLHQ